MLPLLIMTVAFALFSLIIFIMEYKAEVVKLKNKGLDRL
jgi:heme exporter protein C